MKENRKDLAKRSEQFSKLEPTSISAEHNLLKEQKEKWKTGNAIGNGTTNKTHNTTSEILIEDIKKIERKLQYEHSGFVYTIRQDIYDDDYNNASYTERDFSSEKERLKTHKKENTTSDLSSYNFNAEAGVQSKFYGGGVHVNGGANSSSGKFDASREDKTYKTKNAVFEKTFYYRKMRFQVNIRLDDKSVKEAKRILKSKHDREKVIVEFLKNREFIYSGTYYAGGWFRTVANATSSEDMTFSALLKEAKKNTSNYWTAGATATVNFFAANVNAGVGAGRKAGDETQNVEEETNQSNHSKVCVTITEESCPGDNLNRGTLITTVDNGQWDILKKREISFKDFSDVTQIMQEQAEVTGDKDLAEVVKMIKVFKCTVSNKQTPTLLLESEGGAAEHHGGKMGYYEKTEEILNQRPVFKQRGGDDYLYYYEESGRWQVGPTPGEFGNSLIVTSTADTPASTGWKYWTSAKGYQTDSTLRLDTSPSDPSSCCTSIKVAATGPAGRVQGEKMGNYEWKGDWLNGRKLFRGGRDGDQYLRVPTGTSSWSIGSSRDGESGIQSGKATTCPCSPAAGPSVRQGWDGWRYWNDDEWHVDRSISVTCV